MYRGLSHRALVTGALDHCAGVRWPGPGTPSGLRRHSAAEAPVVVAAAAASVLEKEKLREKTLTMESLNPQVKAVEYAVRGPIVIKAAEIEKFLQQVRTRYSRTGIQPWHRL